MEDAGTTRLEIQVLGGFGVRVDGVDVSKDAWSRRNAAAILKILALAPGHRLHREQMMEHLWPEADPRQSANNLYQALHTARRALSSALPDAGQYLLLEDQVIRFGSDVTVEVDAVTFEQAASDARASNDVLTLQSAIDAYGGTLLPDDLYEPWASQRREVLHQAYLELLLKLAHMQEASNSYSDAIVTLRRVVAAEPLHEPAQRSLMRLYALSGQRQQAIRTYQALRESLAGELDIEPEPETERLHEQILSGKLSTTVAEPVTQIHAPPRRMDNLPSSVNVFVGREREKTEVRRLLRGTRLLTLTGPGGCGKSRLSLEVASGEIDRHADGVWLVELASLSDPALIPQAVAGAIGIREFPGQPMIDTLNGWFRTRDVLLILDNCEHLIDACAQFTETLLRSGPGLTILATSREPLRIDGETTWLVPSLTLPDPSGNLNVETLLTYESVQLFVDRAGRVLPGFELTSENAIWIAQLCYRLDGIPLAIELAASRVRALSVEQIVERLSDRFHLLSGGSRAALSRQQTLRAALDWSYNLLDVPERILFARLAVFSGGFDLEAVEAICAASPLDEGDILHLLMLLVDRSLVVASRTNGVGRYTLLETMREYARERLEEQGETLAIGDAHARYYATFALRGAGQIRGADQRIWLARLEREHDNLRLALGWLEAEAVRGNPEPGLLFAGNLYWFWHLRGHFSEGRGWLARLLGMKPERPSRGLGTALTGAGALCLAVGEYAHSRGFLNESIAVWRELDEPDGLAEALNWSGWIELFHGLLPVARERHTEGLKLATRAGNGWQIAMATLGLGFDAAEGDEHESAREYFDRALTMYRSINDYWGTTTAIQQMANLTYRTGDFHEARKRAIQVLALEQAEGDKWLEIQSQSLLGEIARAEGDYETAAAAAQISLSLAAELGNVATRAWTLRDAGFIALATGDIDRAVECLLESLGLFQSRGYQLGMACCLTGLGGVANEKGQVEQCVQFLASAQSSLQAIQMALAPADRLAADRFIALAKKALGESAFDAAWNRGASQTLEDSARQARMLFGQDSADL